MHNGPKVIRQCRAVPKQVQSDQGIHRHPPLIRHKHHEPCHAYTQRHQGPPRVPIIHNTAPRHRDQHRRDTANKNHTADPIHAGQFLREALRLMVQIQVQRDQHEAQRTKREVQPKDPSPVRFLREGTANNRPRHGPDGPHHRQEAKVLSALTKRDQVGDDDLCECDDATTADALDRAADEDHGEVVGDAGDDGAYREENQCDEDQRFAAEDVGEGGEVGLEDSRCEEEGRARPEGLDCTAVELLGDDLFILSVQMNCV